MLYFMTFSYMYDIHIIYFDHIYSPVTLDYSLPIPANLLLPNLLFHYHIFYFFVGH